MFLKMADFEKLFQEYNQSVKQFKNVGPDLEPNRLQRLPAEDTYRYI